MNKICYDFDQAIRQINQIRRLHEDAQECLRQARQARSMMMDLGDGEVVRLLMDALDDRIRQGTRICDRMEHLERALRKNLQRFEETEEELTRGIQGIGMEENSDRSHDWRPLVSDSPYLIGNLRFTDVIYPDFLSQAAEKYFASTL